MHLALIFLLASLSALCLQPPKVASSPTADVIMLRAALLFPSLITPTSAKPAATDYYNETYDFFGGHSDLWSDVVAGRRQGLDHFAVSLLNHTNSACFCESEPLKKCNARVCVCVCVVVDFFLFWQSSSGRRRRPPAGVGAGAEGAAGGNDVAAAAGGGGGGGGDRG